jgi:hypothetical protein
VLTEDDKATLDKRAGDIGQQIGWKLRFIVLPNPQLVGLAAGDQQIIVFGPSRIADLAVHEVDLVLDALERGDRRIVLDEDGDPQLVSTTD